MGGLWCDIGAYETQDPPITYKLNMPAVFKDDTAVQSSPQSSVVKGLLLGLFSVAPLGLLKRKLFPTAQEV
jgi:hypothetical protein